MKFESFPFNHIVIDSFLDEKEFEKIQKIYEKLQFVEKKTDLYHFFQTNELNQNLELKFFTDKIAQIIHQIESSEDESSLSDEKSQESTVSASSSNSKSENSDENTEENSEEIVETFWFNTFASFYTSGNYLLCHDDLLDKRKYAFSYYLEDYPTGELVLFDEKAEKEISRLSVRKNRIVIFEVSEKSYHEVAICLSEGRKAFTGWYNRESVQTLESKPLEIEKFDCKPEPVVLFSEIVGDCMLMDISDYDFSFSQKKLVGPFTQRRVSILDSGNLIAPLIDGFSVKESNFYKFETGDYILLGFNDSKTQAEENQNDKKRKTEEMSDIWDIFVMFSHDIRMHEKEFITYVDKKGQKAFDLVFSSNSIYAVRRNELSFFVPRTEFEFTLAHFVIEK